MLDETRILLCNWGFAGGRMVYDIRYLHPQWDIVIQSYDVRSVTTEGTLIYTSDFQLFRHGEPAPSDFAAYPSNVKGRLWKVIFAIKQQFLDEVRPAVVEHFIKTPYDAGARLALYQQHLDLAAYDVVLTPPSFLFIRRAEAG